jgi:hypothetical protein
MRRSLVRLLVKAILAMLFAARRRLTVIAPKV